MFDAHIVQLNLLGQGLSIDSARFLTRTLAEAMAIDGGELDVHSVHIDAEGNPTCRVRHDGEWYTVWWLNYSADMITQVPVREAYSG